MSTQPAPTNSRKENSPIDTPGLIKAATVSAPDPKALADVYAQYFDLKIVEEHAITEAQAISWGAPGMAGNQSILMASDSGTSIYLRICENPNMPEYTPLRSYGWNAMEFTVSDVEAVAERLENSPFNIIGPPALMNFSNALYPMQAVGPVGEVFYLNEILDGMPEYDLPRANAFVDHIFIAVLATPDKDASIEFYTKKIGWDAGATYDVKYTVINRAFDLPIDTTHLIATTCVGRTMNNEIDQYPDETIERSYADGMLVPGISAMTYMVKSLDGLDIEFLSAPQIHAGALYNGRRSACCVGAAGELVELIEM